VSGQAERGSRGDGIETEKRHIPQSKLREQGNATKRRGFVKVVGWGVKDWGSWGGGGLWVQPSYPDKVGWIAKKSVKREWGECVLIEAD